jgi:hypothetical protein
VTTSIKDKGGTVDTPVLSVGEKVHIITRRLFPDDIKRHFAGEILSVSGDQIRLEGYVFIYNAGMNEYERRPEKRTRIFSLSGAGLIVIVLPRNADLETLHYEVKNRRLIFTDGKDLSLDINEFGPTS